MNREQLAGQWKQVKGEVQKKWGRLTNDDVDIAKGDAEILIGKVQERYGKRKEEAEEEVDEWLTSIATSDAAIPATRPKPDPKTPPRP